MNATTYYVVRDSSGEYVRDPEKDTTDSPCRTPASDQAHQFSDRDEAEAACRRATDRVLAYAD